nr:prolactin receptor-like [Nerophis lumbriciformis]
MLGLLLCLLIASVGCNTRLRLDSQFEERQAAGGVALTTRPLIYYCRSPNMVVFTCWWHPLANLTEGEEVNYVLTYSIDKEPKGECPDYKSAGVNSCHFDASHTFVWNIYCMKVKAVTARQNFTSPEHCFDVADIVKTEAPINLTYELMEAGGDEMGHDVLLSWSYPRPVDLQYGWITLVHELKYRRVSEPDEWKFKESLREPKVQLLGLPNDDYVIRVRCRSHNYGLWSNWSQPLMMSIPSQAPAADKLLVLILVTSISIVALLAIAMRLSPQCVRVKDYFLPPIPKPRIIGIDSLLLKKGNLEEINRHLSSFHGYFPPSIIDTEVWEPVHLDTIHLTAPKECTVPTESPDQVMDAFTVPQDLPTGAHHQLSTTYVQSPYCVSPPQGFSSAPWPAIVSVPGSSYTTMGQPSAPPQAPSPVSPLQELYSCVRLMDNDGLQLVPCLPPAYCELPQLPKFNLHEKEEDDEKLAEHQARKGDAARANES